MNKVKIRPQIESIAPYMLGKSEKEVIEQYRLSRLRKMADNENVYGCSAAVPAAITTGLQTLNYYPDGMVATLTGKLASLYSISTNNIVVGNGSEEMIRLLTRAYINNGDEAVMADLTFPRYFTNVAIEGGRPVQVPLLDGVHDLQAMIKACTERTKMVFICNPNNPTGTIVKKDELLDFIENIPAHILIVLDEAYYEYVSEQEFLETVPLLDVFPNLVILRTFSKIYGLAALRVGYGLMDSGTAAQLKKVKDVFNVNGLAQIAACAALEDQAFISDSKEKNRIERDFVRTELEKSGFLTYPSETNFLFFYRSVRGANVAMTLLENGISVRPVHVGGNVEAFRMTIGTREDNQHVLSIISGLGAG
ncbi:histidinol-phosphate transaminase [Bacillus canaveralius]|uniref:Histidinol-phosphate aminotransferase n=1 Tax=Bacillus canaveralius TaxID=1403243 RepID=A0A2N5GLG6_9BACI|nr:histidinol-phosphate transaminase [Bacillus canaveralius]PLR82481.1 histidinol-phosphate transaminase [Bacillus canaveralius]PLR95652.1 histidinol-phosphate transaminase [Bacillus canaveralius]